MVFCERTDQHKYVVPIDDDNFAPEVVAVCLDNESRENSMMGLEGKSIRMSSGQRNCGLRPRTFWVLFAVMAIMVIVGGGIGVTAMIKNAKSKPTDAARRYASCFLSFIGKPSTS